MRSSPTPRLQAGTSKFGNQEGDGNIAYTQYPENKSKPITSGMMVNPHSGAVHEVMPPTDAPSLPTGTESDIQKLKDNPPQRHSASPQRRTAMRSGSNENSAGHSPLHHHHQARVANKVGGFSPSEGKGSSEGSHGIAPNTPGRSRLRVGSRPDDSPEEGSAVPKFGEWDESDPSAADGFTGIFKKVSEEKQTSATKVPMLIDDSVYLNTYNHDRGSNKSSKFCCFNWGKK